MSKHGKEKRIHGLLAAACFGALAGFMALTAGPVRSIAAEAAAAEAAAAEEDTAGEDAAGAAQGGVTSQASNDGITVTLTTDKASYDMGEEIHYTITIENGKSLAYLEGAEFTYSNTKGLVPAAEDSLPASFPDIQPGESYTLTGVLVGDEAVLAAAAEESGGASGQGTAGAGDSGGASGTGNSDVGVSGGGDSSAGSGGKSGLPVGAIVAVIAVLAVLLIVCLFLMKKKKTRGTGSGKGKGTGTGGAGALAFLLALCVAGEILPVQAAEDSVTLRPYVKFEYGGQEVMIRAVIEFRMGQNRWVVDAEHRTQNKQITCHDPSIFKDRDGVYYVLGTHITGGRSTNLYDWVSLDSVLQESYSLETRNQVRAWNDDASSGSWLGYLWAPDVIYNEAMGKYCIYLSADGDNWKSNIVLLTADYVTGPYEYAGSIVYSGFTAETFGETDGPRVLGTQEIPERYVTNGVANNKWGDMWPNCIDPCVFYADDGRLLMAYGSWSGGIFMLELDKETGLRDYSVSYDTDIHSDAYFGTKIAGGSYASGEASYIQKIGDYYYLFISYGGLEAAGGYNVRVFRSERPDGDYVDALGNTAYYDKYSLNINQSVGVRLMGGYQWRNFTVGQVAQGHNSAFVNDDGKAYIVFHTRTTNGTEGHYVKVHQLFQTREGWLVAAPYLTHGETLKEDGYDVSEVAGEYEVILHELEIDYKGLEVKRPVMVTLQEDGSITGEYTGSWSLESGTPYITLSLNGQEYSGVALQMEVEGTDYQTMVFTALGTGNQVTLWGSKCVE
ncbi:MAG: glycoside hydrolase family 43 protein [Butyrivibrio sp.]|nr:glycoside hydrolase family 43 protein [Acetatifactor muris]MCM1558322.1 glycoside hydrolase family 43 protein [Butyrivibrio sp.]